MKRNTIILQFLLKIVGDFLNISIHGKAIAHGRCIF